MRRVELPQFFRDLSSRLRRRERLQPGSFYDSRAKLCFVLLVFAAVVIAGRAVVIHLFPSFSTNLQHIADRQYQDKIQLAPYRGTIFDRRREPLAISLRVPSLFVNPKVFDPDARQIRDLARILRMNEKEIRSISDKNSYFSWLKRKISKDVAANVTSLEIEGLYQVLEPARFYPLGSSASSIIGFVGTDNQGLVGLERSFNESLKGKDHSFTQSRDARGRTIFLQSDLATPEQSGSNVVLTLDRVIQEIAERSLAEGVDKAKAKGGFAIVTDPHTGRILALASYPNFEPNDSKRIKLEMTRNRAMTDLYEPGSVVKPILVSEALERKKTRPDELHDCSNGTYSEPGLTIHDTHPIKTATTAQIIEESSNICTYKIAKRLGPKALYETYKKYGFTSVDQLVNFPGQVIGRISDWANWRPIRFANVAFGQGMMVSGMELVTAYNAIANGGKLMMPLLVDRVENQDGSIQRSNEPQVISQVMSPETSRTMRQILQGVVTNMSTKAAVLRDYTAAGKTGTTQKVDPKSKAYSKDLRIASFIGFAPATDPNLVIYVVVDEPGLKPYYGATWAAPVFKKIAEASLKYLNVTPDMAPEVAQGPKEKSTL